MGYEPACSHVLPRLFAYKSQFLTYAYDIRCRHPLMFTSAEKNIPGFKLVLSIWTYLIFSTLFCHISFYALLQWSTPRGWGIIWNIRTYAAHFHTLSSSLGHWWKKNWIIHEMAFQGKEEKTWKIQEALQIVDTVKREKSDRRERERIETRKKPQGRNATYT